eukprot:NODE_6100_length_926_cov_32.743462_g5509_i0.p1 GENE.NODE_6100_length_926_cov_32.743462_g5509_i0~~NODE_6100_length_926_cov_32.743462_g5509_i0.p1  ORF type:complete len:260 (-),score=10.92 NODE_6100_length_926_cov_32.743462_g5509_i0:60-839(-)
MVMIVHIGLLFSVGAMPIAAVLISRDCFLYMLLREALHKGNEVVEEGMEKRQRGRTAVMLMSLLFIWQYYVYIFIVRNKLDYNVFSYWFYHGILLLQLLSYIMSINHVFKTPIDTKQIRNPNISTDPSFCKKCLIIKSSKTKHCNTCQKCVQEMDHHCVIINNCVGKGNWKYFISTLLTTTIISLFLIIHSFPLFYKLLSSSIWGLDESQVCLGMVVTVFCLIGSFTLMIFQAVAYWKGVTTGELLTSKLNTEPRIKTS